MIATDADRQVDAQRDAVGERQLDLRRPAAGTEDANFGEHPPTGADHCHGLLRRVIACLVEVFLNLQLSPRPKQHFEVLLGEMHVAGGDIDHKRVGLGLGRRPAQLPKQDLAHHLLDLRPRVACAR